MKKKQGRPVSNKNKVPQKLWTRWTRTGRRVFNQVYYTMRPRQQWVFLHPQAKPHPLVHWQTVRWNAACAAAEAATGAPGISGVKVPKAKRKHK